MIEENDLYFFTLRAKERSLAWGSVDECMDVVGRRRCTPRRTGSRGGRAASLARRRAPTWAHFEYAGRRAHPPRLAPRRRDRSSPRELLCRSRTLVLQPRPMARVRPASTTRTLSARGSARARRRAAREGFDSSVSAGDTAGETFPVLASRSGSAGGDFASSATASCSRSPAPCGRPRPRAPSGRARRARAGMPRPASSIAVP